MPNESVSAPRELIERYFVISEPPSAELIAGIDRFIKEELGITIFSLTGQWGGAEIWEFHLNRNQEIIAQEPPTNFSSHLATQKFRLLLSKKGPLVTAESYTLTPSRPNPWSDCSWDLDEDTTAPRAVAWAQAIAQRFKLHYVDAPSLHHWEIDRYALPDKGSFLDSSEPTAFNILFYEY